MILSTIYVVATGEIDVTDLEVVRHSSIGIYQSVDDAEAAVVNNHGDLFEEGWYNLAVIEEVTFGMYPYPVSESWYRARYLEKSSNKLRKPIVTKITRPSALEQYMAFGIG